MYPEQQAAWSILGWDAQGWDNMENEYSWNLAGEHLFCWEDGTPAQQDAAKSICFHQDTWNALMVNEHGMNCGKYAFFKSRFLLDMNCIATIVV